MFDPCPTCGHAKTHHQAYGGCLSLINEDRLKNIDPLAKRVCECEAYYPGTNRKKKIVLFKKPRLSLEQVLTQ